MSHVTQNPATKSGLNLFFWSIPQTMLLQMGTASILLLLLAEKATTSAIVALGETSEELFRPDRLPYLPFPEEIESEIS
jgi:hypothetical protein